MDHLFLAVTLDLLHHTRSHNRSGDDHQRHHKQDSQQQIAAVPLATRQCGSGSAGHVLYPIATIQLHTEIRFSLPS